MMKIRDLDYYETMTNKLLSVIVPVYNEETNIRPFFVSLTTVLNQLDIQVEIVFVDDGSRDHSYELISNLAKEDNRVKCLRFSRNFGSHTAILAGLSWATGNAAIIISADLQDPPELIPRLLKLWQKGYQVVWAVREARDDPWMKKAFAAAFYKLFRRIALPNFPATGADFGLFDRCVLDNLKQFKELNHIINGIIVWMGFSQVQVPYKRRSRRSGYSKWPIQKRVKVAIDAILSFSYIPIRFISYTGMFISVISFIYGTFLVIGSLFFGLGTSGWPSIMVTVLFLGGIQLIMLGLLGEYVWRINEQVKGRPQYLIMETLGFEQQPSNNHADFRQSDSDERANQ